MISNLEKTTPFSSILRSHDVSIHSKYMKNLYENAQKEIHDCIVPNRKHEEWQFINLLPIYNTPFSVDSFVADNITNEDDIHKECSARFVFMGGCLIPKYTVLPNDIKVTILSRNSIDPYHVNHKLSNIPYYSDRDIFDSLHDNQLQQVIIVDIPENVTLEKPIYVFYDTPRSKKSHIYSSHLIVRGGKNSHATLIEKYIGDENAMYMSLPKVEVHLAERAQFFHYKIQNEGRQAFHIARSLAYVQANSEYHSYIYTFGASISRYEPCVIQQGPEVSFTLDGLAMLGNQQISDTHSVMDHCYSHAQSHQLQKCIITDYAHSIFNGKIFVRRDAQKIDSFQENRNLLLSTNSRANTKPQLEIFADDVRCSHGATIGYLSEEEEFYLCSRGMPKQQARQVLVTAFAEETFLDNPIEWLRKDIINAVNNYVSKL